MRCTHQTVLDDLSSFPCGNCTACAARSAGQKTSMQMLEYYNAGEKALFLTLTFSDENLELSQEYKTIAVYRKKDIKWLKHVSAVQNQFEYLVIKYRQEEEEIINQYWENLEEQFQRSQYNQFKRRKQREPNANELVMLDIKAEEKLKESKTPWGFVHIPPGAPTLELTTIQKFHKRLRKAINTKFGSHFRYTHFTIGEYGGKRGRPHFHCNIYFPDAPPITMRSIKRKIEPIIKQSWKLGSSKTKKMKPAHAGYIAKYLATKRRGFLPPRDIQTQKYTTVWGTPQIIKAQSTGNKHTPNTGLGFNYVKPYAIKVIESKKILDNMEKSDKENLFKCLVLRNNPENYQKVTQLYPDVSKEEFDSANFLFQFAMGSTPIPFEKNGKIIEYNMPLPYHFRRKIFDLIMLEPERVEFNKTGQKIIAELEELKTPEQKEIEIDESNEKQIEYDRKLIESTNLSANAWTA